MRFRVRGILGGLAGAPPQRERDAAPYDRGALSESEDPFLRVLGDAPDDDEVETGEERLAVADARRAARRSELELDDELRREMGL